MTKRPSHVLNVKRGEKYVARYSEKLTSSAQRKCTKPDWQRAEGVSFLVTQYTRLDLMSAAQVGFTGIGVAPFTPRTFQPGNGLLIMQTTLELSN